MEYFMEITDELKEKLIGILNALFPKAKIYLFGSRATGKHGPLSDIDIALDIDEVIPRVKVGEANALMEALNIPIKVDIVDLHGVSDVMREMILKEKVIWKN
jgi:uncharacterized protein